MGSMRQPGEHELSELENRLTRMEPHLRHLVARVIRVALKVEEAGTDSEARLEVLPELAALTEDLDWCLRMEVQGLRAFSWWDVSWTDIGEALGISRQAARQRFRIDGELASIDASVDRRQKVAEARRQAVVARLAAEKAELDAEQAEGIVSEEDATERMNKLMEQGFQQLMRTSPGSFGDEAGLASQAWFAQADARLQELR
jgi:hypothetical protein